MPSPKSNGNGPQSAGNGRGNEGSGLAHGSRVPILSSTQNWACPNCHQTDVTHMPPAQASVASRFHHCAGLRGLTAPMVLAGTDCKVTAVAREDYVGSEIVQTDGNGQPVMAIHTEYADGRNDVAILAPTAQGSISSLSTHH